jgi:hypothetical protein
MTTVVVFAHDVEDSATHTATKSAIAPFTLAIFSPPSAHEQPHVAEPRCRSTPTCHGRVRLGFRRVSLSQGGLMMPPNALLTTPPP